MRILFLNQFFPPDAAPTGILFRELADDFVRAGHEVDFADAGQNYRDGQRKGGRMKREIAALLHILRAGKSRQKADIVISGTSPPCLAIVADRVARKHRAQHIHWAMDVYPEIAVELGEIKRSSLVARLTGWLMGRAYRHCAHVVALDADMAARLRAHRVEPVCIRPWVFQSILHLPQSEQLPQEPWTWVYSGNLGRAHEWETLLRAQQLLETRGENVRLLFQGGGPAWPAAQARAAELGLSRCEWTGYVAEDALGDSLLRCHALAVTQLPATQGLLWPSKLGLIMTLPRPIIFVGPVNGAIAGELRQFPHAGIFTPGDAEGVAHWIADQHSAQTAAGPTLDARAHRETALAAWRGLLS